MSDLPITACQLRGGLPCVRFGDGAEQLVVFPGAGDALQPPDYLERPDWRLRMFFDRYYGRYAKRFRVWVIGRRRRLSEGVTTRDLAGEYAEAIRAEVGPAHVRGESLGGLIAQHLAADEPSLVKSLALVATASRLGASGRTMCQEWLAWARSGRWRDLYRNMTACLYSGAASGLSEGAVNVLGSLMGIRTPDDPSDFIISVQACLSHDTTDRLAGIDLPALVIGGDADPLFPASLQRRTAEALPRGSLRLVPDTAHGAYLVRQRDFDDAMLAFFEEVTGPMA